MSGFSSKPLALTCHLCGREYGTKSLPIHIPQCEAKWWQHQEVLPKWCQKAPPEAPDDLAGIEAYNQAAWSVSQRALNQCPFCKRSFKPDSLVVHFNSCRERGDQDPWSVRKKGPQSRPRALVCYICGQQFGTASLEIHQKQCLIKWEQEQQKLPPSQRKPAPKPPQSLGASPGGKIDIQAQNEAAFDANLLECENCGRTFAPDRLSVHQRSCKPGKPLKPRLTATTTTSSSSSTTSPSPADEPLPQRRPGTPDFSEGLPPSGVGDEDRVPCSKCGRKFASDRIDRHEATCRVGTGSSPASNSPAARRNAYDPRAAASGGGASPTRSRLSTAPPGSRAQAMMGGDGDEGDDRVECGKCGRKFAPDRIDHHESACKGGGGGGRGGAAAANPAARRNAYDPRAAAKEAKRAASGGGGPRPSLKERMAMEHAKRDDTRVECMVCGRKFSPDRIDKHQSICTNLVNIDNRRPTSTSMGQGLGGGGGGGRLNATTSPVRRPMSSGGMGATLGGGRVSPTRRGNANTSPLRHSTGSGLPRPRTSGGLGSSPGRSPPPSGRGGGAAALRASSNASPLAPGSGAAPSPAKFCHSCGAAHAPNARFCVDCGEARVGV